MPVLDSDDTGQMIRDCENRESKLSEWEQGFIASCADQHRRGRDLSQKQYDTLARIWGRVT